MHLKVRREHKKDDMSVGKSEVGMELQGSQLYVLSGGWL